MTETPTLRVARPTNNLKRIREMYVNGLECEVLGEFVDHQGFDGVILGHPNSPYHIEFTSKKGHIADTASDPDHLLVFYIPDREEWERRCVRMRSAGFVEVPSFNPYWDVSGVTFRDVDGYRVVLQNAKWSV